MISYSLHWSSRYGILRKNLPIKRRWYGILTSALLSLLHHSGQNFVVSPEARPGETKVQNVPSLPQAQTAVAFSNSIFSLVQLAITPTGQSSEGYRILDDVTNALKFTKGFWRTIGL